MKKFIFALLLSISFTCLADVSPDQLDETISKKINLQSAEKFVKGLSAPKFVAINVMSGDAFSELDHKEHAGLLSMVTYFSMQEASPFAATFIKNEGVSAFLIKPSNNENMVVFLLCLMKKYPGKYSDETVAAMIEGFGFHEAMHINEFSQEKKNAEADAIVRLSQNHAADQEMANVHFLEENKADVFAALIERQKGFPAVTDMMIDFRQMIVETRQDFMHNSTKSLVASKSISTDSLKDKTPAEIAVLAEKIAMQTYVSYAPSAGCERGNPACK